MIMRMLGLEGLVTLMRLAAAEDSHPPAGEDLAANDNGGRVSGEGD